MCHLISPNFFELAMSRKLLVRFSLLKHKRYVKFAMLFDKKYFQNVGIKSNTLSKELNTLSLVILKCFAWFHHFEFYFVKKGKKIHNSLNFKNCKKYFFSKEHLRWNSTYHQKRYFWLLISFRFKNKRKYF